MQLFMTLFLIKHLNNIIIININPINKYNTVEYYLWISIIIKHSIIIFNTIYNIQGV